MQLSIIILNYNVRYFLETCVLSVQKAIEHLDAEIIVVDNNSSDESCHMMKSRFPNIQLIENNENVGFPKGNNIGVANAKGEFICILNPDTVIAEDTFTKILAQFSDEKFTSEIGIIGCKLTDGCGNFLPESKRGLPTPWVSLTKIFGLYKMFPKLKLFNQYYAQHIQQNTSAKTDILVGAFMVMKRQLYNDLGGFDENCFMYSDDIDLSYLSIKSGKSNYYFHETTVIHYKGESTVKDGAYIKRFQEAMNFFYKKHFKVSFFFSLFMKIGIVIFSIIKMFQGKPTAVSKPNSYILISNNNDLKLKLELQLQTKITQIVPENSNQFSTEFASSKTKTEYIIDLDCYTFAQAITFFNQNKHKNTTFKLRPPHSNFIIGSNSSNDRGEVIVF